MKFLVIMLTFLTVNTYASKLSEADQVESLTHYDHGILGGYHGGKDISHGTYTVVRDHETPNQVRIKVFKIYPEVNETKVGPGVQMVGGRLVNLGKTSIRDNRKESYYIDLNFEEAQELLEGEVEEIVLELDFRNGNIEVPSISINSVDSDRSYDIDTDKFFLPENTYRRYEFSVVEE